jgi:predicted dehydrogenase
MTTTRREFIKTTATATLGASILPSLGFSKEGDQKVRLGFIGVGLRGQNHLEQALLRKDVEVVAICDVQQRMIDMSLGIVATAGKQKPQVINDGPNGYKKLLERNDIDAVVISTPWEWHTKMCLDRLRSNNRHDH